jgi:tRNA pseudouridine38-40 synthase
MEVSYKGTNYAGFQVQENANTIQGEIERALAVVFKADIKLTGSSRTDAGVHARQNYFHFDFAKTFNPRAIYNINALIPADIVVKGVKPVKEDANCRFLATSREYSYYLTSVKDPFNTDTAWYYPYKIEIDLLNAAANSLFSFTDFTSFCKRNTKVFTHNCTIIKSNWSKEDSSVVFNVSANRFLRGMVRGLVATMLLVGRKKMSVLAFEDIIQAKDCTKASFATPAHGLFLDKVNYPPSVLV